MRSMEFVQELRSQVKRDDLGDVAAMMAYYAVFALFPMLLFIVTLGLLVVPESALAEGAAMVTRALPEQVGLIIQRQLARMQQVAGGGIAVGSALVALWGASRGAVSLGRALNRVFDVKETRPWWRVQLTGVLVTLGVAILLIGALGLLLAGPAVGHFLMDRFGLGSAFDAAWTIGRWAGAALLVMVIWSLLYHFLPNVRAPLKLFTFGAAAGVALWIGLTLLFALYVRNFGKYDQVYGALGAVVIFVTWLWLSNLALLAGAEVNDVLERGHGQRRDVDRDVAEDRHEHRHAA